MNDSEKKQAADALRGLADMVEDGRFDQFTLDLKNGEGQDPRQRVSSMYSEMIPTGEQTIKIELHREPNVLFGGRRPVKE